MPRDKLYSEIFQEFNQENTRQGKLYILNKYDHPRFRYFFKLLYDDSIEFDVDIPEYRPSVEPAGLNWTYLDAELSKLYRYIKNHPQRTNVKPEKLKSLLLVTLESLHKDEADLLVKLFKKDLGIHYLTKELVQEALPGIEL